MLLFAPGLRAAHGATQTTRVFHGPGLALRYPGGLFLSTRPFDSISDPVQRFVLSTYRVPGGRPNSDGDYTPPPTGVIAELLEDVPAPDPDFEAPARPASFTLPALTDNMEGHGARFGEIAFRDHARDFVLLVGVGNSARPAKVALLLRVLDGLTVTVPPPSVTDA